MADVQPTACPADAKLRDFLDGRLPVAQMDELASHFEGCESCQQRLEAIDDSEVSIDSWASPGSDIPYAQETQCNRAVDNIAEGSTRSDVPAIRKEPPKQLGEYELLEPLGEGGMGAVYRARHVTLGSIAAIKLLHPQRQADRHTIDRFEREMVALGKLDHPHIVRAIDAGEDQGIHYLVMEFVRGIDLSKVLVRRKQLSVADACEVTRQAALGLEYVHRHGRVHRDVKPSNLMLAADGNIKLLDLGLAQVEEFELDEESIDSDEMELLELGELTRTHQIMGTIEYMAPEQASDTSSVDYRADIYSLGCTLYKLLAGQSPFASTGEVSQLSQVLAHVQTPAPPLKSFREDIPDGLITLVEHMLAKSPEKRPSSAERIAYELEPFCQQADLPALLRAPLHAETVGGGTTGAGQSPFANSPAAKKPFPWVGAILTLSAIVLALGGLAMYGVWAANAQGSLFIKVSSQEAEMELLQWPAYVVDVNTGENVTQVAQGELQLPPGEYRIKPHPRAGVTYDVTNFTVTRGNLQVINIGDQAAGEVASAMGSKGQTNRPPPVLPKPEAVGPPVELAALIEPERDIQNQDWQLTETALVGNNQRPCIVQIPYHPPDYYRLEATVERLAGNESIMLGLVAGETPVIVSIDGWPHRGSFTGLYRVNGIDTSRQHSSQVSRGRKLQNGKPAKVVATVKHDNGNVSVQLEIDQQPVFSWNGSVSSVGQSQWMYSNEPTALTIGKFTSPMRVSDIRLIPYSEGGHPIEFATPQENPQLAAAQRAIWKGGSVSLREKSEPSSSSDEKELQVPLTFAESFSDLSPETEIAVIDMRQSSWLHDADMPYFADLDSLESLDLQGTPITLAGLEQLGSLPRLQSLNLAETNISINENTELAGTPLNMPSLTRIDLGSVDTDDSLFSAISGLTSLEYLLLDDTRVTGTGLALLSDLQNLQSLVLDRSHLDAAGLAQLPRLATLKQLSLVETEIRELSPLTQDRFPELAGLNLLSTPVSAEQVAMSRKQLPQTKIISGYDPLDLAPLVDIERDTLQGEWSNTGKQITVHSGNPARLALPVELPNSFDLSMVMRRVKGNNAPVFAMPLADGTQVLLGFDHWPGEGGYTILHGIDGAMERESPAKTNMRTFPPDENQPVKLDIHVRRQGEQIEVVAERNEEVVLQWKGNANRLYPAQGWFSPDRRRLTISCYNGEYALDQLTVTPLEGPVALYNPLPARYGPDREVARELLAVGGRVRIKKDPTNDQITVLEDIDQLPAEPFWVWQVGRMPAEELPSEWFAAVGKLHYLDQIYFANCQINNDALAHLAELRTLRQLSFIDTTLSDQGLEQIAKVSPLQKLEIRQAPVTDAGIAHLEGHSRLQILTIPLPSVGDRAAEAAARIPQLQHLNLCDSQLSETGLESLQGHASLLRLYADRCPQLKSVDLANLITLPQLNILDLREDQLGPEACYSLGLMTGLQRLRLWMNPIGDQGMQRLGGLTNLLELHAGATQVTDASLPTIAKLEQLQHLGLTDNQGITDQSIEVLSRLGMLRELKLSGTSLTRSGVKQLRTALPRCRIYSNYDSPTRRKLDLRGKDVTDETLAQALEGEGLVIELRLEGEGITDKSLPLLASLPALQRLDFDNAGVTNQGIAALAESNSLKRLEFWNMPEITGEVTKAMAEIPNLTAVTFKATGVYGPGLERLHDTKVRNLHIGHYRISGDIFRQYIVPFGEFDNLDLAGAAITDADIPLIVPLHVKHFLHLGFNKNLVGPGLIYIADMPQLGHLSLHATRIDDAGLVYLAGADQLTKLTLRETLVTDASIETLASLTLLEQLDLSQTRFTPEGVAELQKRLPRAEIQADDLTQPESIAVYPPANGKQVPTSGWKPSWSPDGKQLVYGIGHGEALQIIDLETGEKQSLEIRGQDPAWSPDGQWIAYAADSNNDSDKTEIWVTRPDTTGVQKIAEGTYPFWIHGGKTLVFHSQELPGLVSVELEKPQEIKPFYRNIPTLFAAATNDGQQIAYAINGHVYVVNRETREAVADVSVADSDTGLVAFSPDGSLLAYSPFKGYGQGTWLIHWDTNQKQRLNVGTYQSPAFSPDGNQLAFDYNRYAKAQEQEIWITPVDLSWVKEAKQ